MEARVGMEPLLAAFGVPVTVTLPGEPAIETTGVWLSPGVVDVPGGLDAGRREPLRVMALSRSAVGTVPERTEILAPELSGGSAVLWHVDTVDNQDFDCVRVTLIRRP